MFIDIASRTVEEYDKGRAERARQVRREMGERFDDLPESWLVRFELEDMKRSGHYGLGVAAGCPIRSNYRRK